MARPFAPPELFAAVAGYPGPDEDDLQPGTQLRLLVSPALGLPLAPFAVWRAQTYITAIDIAWTEAEGALHGYLPPYDDRSVVVATRFFRPPGQRFELAVIEGLSTARTSVVARRSAHPWIVAAPTIAHLRIRGEADSDEFDVFRLHEEAVNSALDDGPADLMSLPVDAGRHWYAEGLGQGPSFDRVKRGAPRRLGPPDAPDGSPDEPSPDDEADRIRAVSGEIDRRLEAMLRDQQPPWLHRDPASNPAGSQRTSLKTSAGLLMQGLDPGVGRYLGLMTTLDDVPPDPNEVPYAWVAAGLFALDPRAPLPDGRVTADAFADPGWLAGRLEARLREVFPEVAGVADRCRADGLLVVPLAAVAAGPLLPDRPEAPIVTPGRTRWLVTDPLPSSSYRAELLVPDAPLAPLAALARDAGGGWESLHPQVDVPGGVRRAVPLVLGRNRDGVGILADPSAPESPDPLYRVRLGDLFGRYGEPTDYAATAPPRPPPPTPAPETEIERATVLGPGKLTVRVPVPGLHHLAPGARPIATVNGELDGVQDSAAATPVAELEFRLPDVAPGKQVTATLKVRFVDDRGVASAPATQAVTIADPLRPSPLDTGVGIIWTSRPGPAEDVELRLTWKGASERYRVYMADARSLVTGADRLSRGEIAAAASNLGAVDRRKVFRLLTDPPLEADDSGRAVFDARLPRSLQTVQLVRVVPVSAANLEAEFSRCPLVPVAVPSDRRPPPPTLAVSIEPGTGRASIDVTARGLDRGAESRPPEVRLRRAVGEVVDPIYARALDPEPLAPDGDAFVAHLDDGPDSGLLPYVRYVYWAEVRMPPERRLTAGLQERAGAVAPTQPDQARDMPSLFSATSPPAYAMRTPAKVPVLSPAHVRAVLVPDAAPGSARLVLAITSAPKAHALAVDSHRLQVWLRQGDGPIAQLTNEGSLPAIHGRLDWASDPLAATDPLAPATVFLAIVDPLGRRGELLELTVPALALEEGWRSCRKCSTLAWASRPEGPCILGDGHDFAFSRRYALPRDVAVPSAEAGWRHCAKCHCLEYIGDGSPGACAGGGQHEHGASGQYVVPMEFTPAGAQPGWRRCTRCRCLVFAEAATKCPGGDSHLFSPTHRYSVYVVP